MVATALMMSSTLGFSKVEPMKIELIVDDFLSSIYYKIISLNNLYIIISSQLFQYFLGFLKFLSFLVFLRFESRIFLVLKFLSIQ